MLTPSHEPLLYVGVATPTKFDPRNRNVAIKYTSMATVATMMIFERRGRSTIKHRYMLDFGLNTQMSARIPSVMK